jgi:hypothetical protein
LYTLFFRAREICWGRWVIQAKEMGGHENLVVEWVDLITFCQLEFNLHFYLFSGRILTLISQTLHLAQVKSLLFHMAIFSLESPPFSPYSVILAMDQSKFDHQYSFKGSLMVLLFCKEEKCY